MHSSETELKPRFIGWFCSFYKQDRIKETVMTYLTPIPKPITDYQTISEMFERSRELRLQSNMQYCHITLDIGAAMKAYQVLWSNPQIWYDIIIHLGDFHAMMTFFGTIGCFVKGSGFEEIIFQVGLCSSGSIKGVISGKHYNRAWYVHEVFSAAIFRLFLEIFEPTEVAECLNLPTDSFNDLDEILNHAEIKDYLSKIENTVNEFLRGDHGKTGQYWMHYVKLVHMQLAFHYAIKSNNHDLRLAVWEKWIPFCFATNHLHYARYGTYCTNFLQHIDETHPGAKEEMIRCGISVRRNTLGIGQAIDLAGEQTYMKSAKTAGRF